MLFVYFCVMVDMDILVFEWFFIGYDCDVNIYYLKDGFRWFVSLIFLWLLVGFVN